ncbi:hypothetical protein TCON_2102 [Astathelohania contejeani]|uniref:CHY-type domain-containing protein n=1 Tax=Astathelohania contejeani TaxID=164912 RepID=A0ABQ7HWY7_9MICR|nr:hypothetical protein TCON_2102 [Thelohania contejeani]
MLESNKIVNLSETQKQIYLNLKKDLIFDIDEIIIQYSSDTNTISIPSKELPDKIKDNIVNDYNGNIENYIKFLELNIEEYLKGSKPNIRPTRFEMITQLPEDYIYPIRKCNKLNVEIGIKKKGIGLFMCKELNFEVECNKCRRTQQAKTHCKFCKIDFGITYSPTINPNFLGYLELNNCRLLCFNYNNYQFNCDSCNTNYESKGVSSINFKCYMCHQELYFSIVKLRIKDEKKKDVKIALHIGTSLPDKGACKHYKKSYRWFRFPCCNSLYPCDICHDENNSHVAELANKMICGLCSREQTVNKECQCGMSVKKFTSHWEGGKGTRNKTIMSKKDRKKYKNK